MSAAGDQQGAVLTVRSTPAARLVVRLGLRSDSSGSYLAVTKSDYVLYDLIDGEPLVRLEYQDDMRTAPSCHWQVHAERGALSHLLTLSGHEKPHQLSSLHFPVGGARHRPCIEDFLQFVVQECRLDAEVNAAQVLQEGRDRWRRRQLATMVRDVPEEAVRALAVLGYGVTDPPDGPAPVRRKTLDLW